MIKLVTDSTFDLPVEIQNKLDVTIIPGYVNMDGFSYQDGVDLTREEFYTRLPDCKTHPTTSAPGIGTFIQTYRDLLENGADQILSIHISPRLSNIANIAQLAAEELDGNRVHVIDSGNLTMSTGLLVEKAASLIAAGLPIAEIKSELKETSERTYSFSRLKTLEYLRRSGRVSDLKNGLASLLDIKPIMKMHSGVPEMEMVRTMRHANQRVVELVSSIERIERIGVVHANARSETEALLEQLKPLLPADIEILVNEVTPVIGVHVGPGAICFCIIAADKISPDQHGLVGGIVKKMRGFTHEEG